MKASRPTVLTLSLPETVHTLFYVVPTSESVVKILKCSHSKESYWAVFSCGAVYYAVRDGWNFESVDEILKCDLTIQKKATEQYFPVVLFIMLYEMVEILSPWMKS